MGRFMGLIIYILYIIYMLATYTPYGIVLYKMYYNIALIKII